MNGPAHSGGRPPRIDDAAIAAWVDGAMDPADAATMERMMQQDDILAARAARLRVLDDLVREAIPEEPVDDALLARLGLAGPERPSAEVVPIGAARAAKRIVPERRAGWRIAAQVALAVGLGSTLVALTTYRNIGRAPAPAEYTALGDKTAPAARTANALLMFAPGTRSAEARRLAEGAGLTVVAGPSPTGAWQVWADPARREGALGKLRANPAVTMAEPLDAGPAQ